jgi:hypothetical protein
VYLRGCVSTACRHTVDDTEVTSDPSEGGNVLPLESLAQVGWQEGIACILRSSQVRARQYWWHRDRLIWGG